MDAGDGCDESPPLLLPISLCPRTCLSSMLPCAKEKRCDTTFSLDDKLGSRTQS